MKQRLLVVDDDEKSRRLARDVLAHAGYGVSIASSGEEALTLAAQDRFAVVLLDIQLPGLGGVETFKALRALPGCAALPIVAMTASVMPHERSSLIDEGFDAFLPKPLSIKELIRVVAAAVEGAP